MSFRQISECGYTGVGSWAFSLLVILVLHAGPAEVSVLSAAGLAVGSLFAVPLGWLSFAQLLVVSVVTAAADIAFKTASGAYLKALVPGEHLLLANARFESTTWTATALGPPLGGAAFGLFGPVATVLVNAVGFVFSAAGNRAIGGGEPRPVRAATPRLRARDLPDGWRYILTRPVLRIALAVAGLLLLATPLLLPRHLCAQPVT